MLIFDAFASPVHAAMFVAAAAELEPELSATIYSSVAEALRADPFPGTLTAPVVHIERPDTSSDHAIEEVRELGGAGDLPTGAEREQALEALAGKYGGRFAGT